MAAERNTSGEATPGETELPPVFHPASLDELRALEAGGAFEGLLSELLQMFLSDTPHQLDQMLRAAQAEDLARVKRIAHRLKSGALQLGALRFAYFCRELEMETALTESRLQAWVLRLQSEFDGVRTELQREVRKLARTDG